MNAIACAVAAASLAVDTGWQPLDDGSYEYIIQIEPSVVSALMDGEAVTSDLPPIMRNVRRYRIVVGTDTLPRIDPPVAEPPATDPYSAEPDRTEPAGPEPTGSEPSASPSPRSDSPPAGESPDRPELSTSAPFPGETGPEDQPGAVDVQTPAEPADDAGHSPPAELTDRTAAEPAPIQLPSRSDAERLTTHRVEQPPQMPDDAAAGEEADRPDNERAGAPARPWGVLMFVAVGLFASLSGNVYMGWITWETRQRYRALVRER